MSGNQGKIPESVETTKLPYNLLKLPYNLQMYLDQFRSEYNFDPKEWIKMKTKKLNEYMRENGLKACVVSVSGGVDSAVTYLLALEAQKQPNSPIQRVLGLSQPIYSTPSVCDRAHLLSADIVTIDQSGLFDDLKQLVTEKVGLSSNQFSDGQLKSYMRTPVNYYAAQLVTASGLPCIVLGTGNMDGSVFRVFLQSWRRCGGRTVDC